MHITALIGPWTNTADVHQVTHASLTAMNADGYDQCIHAVATIHHRSLSTKAPDTQLPNLDVHHVVHTDSSQLPELWGTLLSNCL